MMADENKTEETVVTAETENAVTNEQPAIADTPSEAADNQDPAQGAEGQPRRGRGGRGGERGEGRGRGRGRDDRRGNRREEEDDGIIEKLVHINRVSNGKAREVPEAISKATASARKKMIRVPLKEGRTLHHDGRGHFGAGKVTVRTAPPGTGIIAGGPMRAVFESLGVADVVTKSVGTSNPYNMIRATFDALQDQTSPKSVAQRRGKKVADLLGRGGASEVEAEADAAAIAE
jgi:small subunit ribosomal protein S5